MRIGNVDDRATLITGVSVGIDIASASDGRFGPNIQELYDRWGELRQWANGIRPGHPGQSFAPEQVGNPVPRPRQVFAIGLNYRDHASETRVNPPSEPAVFTKFQTSLGGPFGTIELPLGQVDWEVELVIVIGSSGRHIRKDDAWSHVAGLTVGQDLTERQLQQAGPVPQFSLAKSYPGFGPIGPVVVTSDELENADDLELGCLVNGEQVQQSRSSHMIFPVRTLIAKLSGVTPLLAGDLIFSGTPAGIGAARTPPRFLAPGDELTSYVEGVGEMKQTLTSIALPPDDAPSRERLSNTLDHTYQTRERGANDGRPDSATNSDRR